MKTSSPQVKEEVGPASFRRYIELTRETIGYQIIMALEEDSDWFVGIWTKSGLERNNNPGNWNVFKFKHGSEAWGNKK